MRLNGVKIGFAMTGSHCTLGKIFPEIKTLLAEGAEIYPLLSPSVDRTDTRFGEAIEWKTQLVKLTGQKIINSIVNAEPLGPKVQLDAFIIAPCTGNTLAKLANGITDTAVLMGAKAQLRNQRPVILAISTNDGLGLNAKNLGVLLATRNIFMVPFGQDSPFDKPNSLVAKTEMILPTVMQALDGRQLQPILINLAAEQFPFRG
jgi:dipicolinate synthase subunit B